jgi:hypothetical protein
VRQPTVEARGVGQPIQNAAIEINHRVHLGPAAGVAEQPGHEGIELGREQEAVHDNTAREASSDLVCPVAEPARVGWTVEERIVEIGDVLGVARVAVQVFALLKK